MTNTSGFCLKPNCFIPTMDGFCTRHAAPLARAVGSLSDEALGALMVTLAGLIESEAGR